MVVAKSILFIKRYGDYISMEETIIDGEVMDFDVERL